VSTGVTLDAGPLIASNRVARPRGADRRVDGGQDQVSGEDRPAISIDQYDVVVIVTGVATISTRQALSSSTWPCRTSAHEKFGP